MIDASRLAENALAFLILVAFIYFIYLKLTNQKLKESIKDIWTEIFGDRDG